jgi:molybdopterin-guanine dinucleotide biosynthesis protein A
VSQVVDGWYQATQAVYRSEPMATACDRALTREQYKILASLAEMEG